MSMTTTATEAPAAASSTPTGTSTAPQAKKRTAKWWAAERDRLKTKRDKVAVELAKIKKKLGEAEIEHKAAKGVEKTLAKDKAAAKATIHGGGNGHGKK